MARALSLSLAFTATALVLTLGLTRCAMFGSSDSFDRAEAYSVTAPPGWTEADRGEADRAYRTPSNGLATLTSSCTRPTDASLELLTRHLLFGLRKVHVLERTEVSVGGVPGLKSRVRATLEGKSVELEVVVARRGACVFDFSLMHRGAPPPADRQAFERFVASFRLGKEDRR